MTEFFVVLLPCLTVCYLAHRAAPFVDRLIRISEGQAPLPTADRSSGNAPGGRGSTNMIEIPDDLLAVANMESEAWAIEDSKATIREKYALLGDWQAVRRAVGVGELPV